MPPLIVVVIIPSHWLGDNSTVITDGDAIRAGVDAVVVSQFLELPKHPRSRHQHVERHRQLLPSQCNDFIARIVVASTVTKF